MKSSAPSVAHFLGENTRVGSYPLVQGAFPTQG